MAVLTAAAAMATVTIEVEKRSPIMTSLCVAVGYCDERLVEHLRRRGLDRLYRGSGSRENAGLARLPRAPSFDHRMGAANPRLSFLAPSLLDLTPGPSFAILRGANQPQERRSCSTCLL